MEYNDRRHVELHKALGVFLLAVAMIIGFGFAIGELYFWEGQEAQPLDKDIAYLEKLAGNSPDDKTLVELGWLYYRKGDYQKASKVLEKAVKMNKSNPAAHFNLGLTYQEIDLLDKAEQEFIRTLDLDPESKYAYFALGKLYYVQEKWDESAKQFALAAENDPISADNFYWLGKVQEKMGHRVEAKAAYQKALERIPDHAEAKEAYYRIK